MILVIICYMFVLLNGPKVVMHFICSAFQRGFKVRIVIHRHVPLVGRSGSLVMVKEKRSTFDEERDRRLFNHTQL